ncbi:MAG TPA: hypothetical protein PK014_14770 [Thermoanaerobaculia bacterium]|nr:hypothetical protein [Thermoanaerobaculia bacterium]HUM31289.1 hypothetical protein [Thermoanaerobaculia bacterium]HXK69640.1 hypothetical protein [Thermoanaerobaculia bacterium]
MTILTILREHRVYWLPTALLLLLNLVLFVGYHYVFFGKIRAEWNRRAQLEGTLEVKKHENQQLNATLASQKRAQESLAQFYERINTKEHRLTLLLAHLDDLTRQAGLIPHAWGFGEDKPERFLPVTAFEISFPLEGTYANVRKLLHFLELSEQFITVSNISLREAGELGQNVKLTLGLVTYFHEDLPEEETQRPPARRRPRS